MFGYSLSSNKKRDIIYGLLSSCDKATTRYQTRTEPVTYADGVVAEGSEFTQMTSRE
jgi:hypothetical protein